MCPTRWASTHAACTSDSPGKRCKTREGPRLALRASWVALEQGPQGPQGGLRSTGRNHCGLLAWASGTHIQQWALTCTKAPSICIQYAWEAQVGAVHRGSLVLCATYRTFVPPSAAACPSLRRNGAAHSSRCAEHGARRALLHRGRPIAAASEYSARRVALKRRIATHDAPQRCTEASSTGLQRNRRAPEEKVSPQNVASPAGSTRAVSTASSRGRGRSPLKSLVRGVQSTLDSAPAIASSVIASALLPVGTAAD